MTRETDTIVVPDDTTAAGGRVGSPAQRAQSDRIRLTHPHRLKLVFMVASLASLALSVGLWISGQQMQAIFVGLWVPSIHSLGTLVLTGEEIR